MKTKSESLDFFEMPFNSMLKEMLFLQFSKQMAKIENRELFAKGNVLKNL
jgi:hypothetical protein